MVGFLRATVDWVETEGPLKTEVDLAKREGLLPADKTDADEVRACLKRFAERAWRRPVQNAEVERYVKLKTSGPQVGQQRRGARERHPGLRRDGPRARRRGRLRAAARPAAFPARRRRHARPRVRGVRDARAHSDY